MRVQIPQDSGVILFDLDSTAIKAVHLESTPAMSINYIYKDKRLEVRAKTKPPDVTVKYRIIEIYKPHPVYIDVVHKVRELYPYQKALMYIGLTTILFITIKIIIKLK